MNTSSRLPKGSKRVFQGKIFSVWQWEQTLFDGTTKTFELATRPDTAYVLPILPDGRILLVHDEQPHRESVLTLPRGRVEEGEEPSVAAARECREETGYTVGSITPWFSSAPHGKALWQSHFFIGKDLTQTGSPQQAPGERIALQLVSFEEFVELGAAGKLQHLQLQIMLLQAKLDPENMKNLKELLYGQ